MSDFRQLWRSGDDREISRLNKIVDLLEQILDRLTPKATKLTILFEGVQQGMPATLTDVQSVSASIVETDAAGNVVTFDPTKITWSVADATVVALTSNPDGTASFKALKVGSTTVTASDSGSGLSGSDTITVISGAATSLVIKFGTPA